MKELTRKVLEAGLVDKHTARLFERWGQLDEGAADLVGKKQVTEQTLAEFTDDMEVLLEQQHEVRETRLEVSVRKPPVELYCARTGVFSAAEDEMERFIIAPRYPLERGDQVWPAETTSEMTPMVVLDVVPLYQDEKLIAYQVTVDKSE